MPICLPIFESPSYEIMRYDGMDEKPKRRTIPTSTHYNEMQATYSFSRMLYSKERYCLPIFRGR